MNIFTREKNVKNTQVFIFSSKCSTKENMFKSKLLAYIYFLSGKRFSVILLLLLYNTSQRDLVKIHILMNIIIGRNIMMKFQQSRVIKVTV